MLGLLATLCYAHHTSYVHTMAYWSRMVPYSFLTGLQVWLTGAGLLIAAVLLEEATRVSMEKMDKVIHIVWLTVITVNENIVIPQTANRKLIRVKVNLRFMVVSSSIKQ